MIFVVVGTQHNSFKRLLQKIQELIDKGIIKEEVIVQKGTTNFESKNMKLYDFISQDEFNKYIQKADIIITHGGVSSIVAPLKLAKKVIAVPRIAKYGEHVNDHQKQIVENFAKQGFIIGVEDMEELPKAIEHARNGFKPNKFDSNTDNIVKIIEDFIKDQRRHLSLVFFWTRRDRWNKEICTFDTMLKTHKFLNC